MDATDVIFTGRDPLITDLSSIDDEDMMLAEFARIAPSIYARQTQIAYLIDYYKSYHPAIFDRDNKVRTDIDNRIVVNYAWAATRDIVGYYLGKPVQYVHRSSNTDIIADVAEMNRLFDAEGKSIVDKDVAVDTSICGMGFLGTFKDNSKKNGSSLKFKRCDPMFTGVVVSSAADVDELYCYNYFIQQPDVVGGTSNKAIYTIWTANHRWIIEAESPAMFSTASANVIASDPFYYGGYLPIQEYDNNVFRIGDWEPALPLMDGIDATASDRANDIQQTVQAILVALGVDLTATGVLEMLEEKGLLCVPNIAEGVAQPVIDYINSNLDPTVGTSFSEYLESCMNVVIGVPDRKTKSGSGGDTGDAVYLRDGWMDIDLVASFKEGSFIKADRNTLGAALYLLSLDKLVTNISPADIEIKFSRNKTSNIQTKSQAFSTFVKAGMNPRDAIEIIDVTTDVNAMYDRFIEWRDEVQSNSLEYAKQQQSELGGETPNKAVGSKNDIEAKQKE